MAFSSIEEWIQQCEKTGSSMVEVVIQEEMHDRNVSREEVLQEMAVIWEAMKNSEKAYDRNIVSHSGLAGGAAGLMDDYVSAGSSICGDVMGHVITRALAMGESNACMKRIVAAPTAGACGVLPAVLVTAAEQGNFTDEDIEDALFVAGQIGQVVSDKAYIAGASGGCQAEIGTASSMAAGALAYLYGGTPQQVSDAAAMAMKNLLGLVCDPVAGLVEVPCIKRNVIGAVNAMASADMALAGIQSRIPADQVFDAMKEVGDMMHSSLRETAQGGLAETRAARELRDRL